MFNQELIIFSYVKINFLPRNIIYFFIYHAVNTSDLETGGF